MRGVVIVRTTPAQMNHRANARKLWASGIPPDTRTDVNELLMLKDAPTSPTWSPLANECVSPLTGPVQYLDGPRAGALVNKDKVVYVIGRQDIIEKRFLMPC